MSDAVWLLLALFVSAIEPMCGDACDSNDDGALYVSDVIHLLRYLFGAGAAPKEPFPACGADPTEDLVGCAGFAPCPAK